MYYSNEVDNDIAADPTGRLGDYYGLGAVQVASPYAPVVDHIPAQNQAGSDLAAVVSQWAAAKQNGTATIYLGETLAARARQIGAAFATFARSLHNERADRGASEIEALANGIAAGIESDAGKIPVAPVVLTPPQQVITQPPPDIMSGIVPAITRTVDRAIGSIVGSVTGGGGMGPVDYGLPPESQGSGLPGWVLPAAAGVGLVLLLSRSRRSRAS